MDRVMALTKELCEIKSGIVCEENEALFRRISQEIPLDIFRYNSGEEHNGWIIPDKWKVEEAKVFFDGDLIYDGTINALGVAQYIRGMTNTGVCENNAPPMYFQLFFIILEFGEV